MLVVSRTPSLNYSPVLDSIIGETGFAYLRLAREVESRGARVISFGIGQPDYVTPIHIRESAKKALDDGFTGYTETAGIPELREAIASYLNKRYGASVDPEEVIVTTGAKTAVFMALASYVRPGDEVIIPEPSYYAYAQVVKIFGGTPVFVPMRFIPGEGFKLDIESIEAVVSERTRAIVITNPHNPTGSVFDNEQVDSIMDLARRKGLLIVSDEIYDNFVFNGGRFKSFLSYHDWRDYLVYVNGFSKTFSMTGWRLGYLVARREVIPRLIDLAVTIYSCTPSFAQKAAVTALKGDWGPVEEMVSEFGARARLLASLLEDVPGFEPYEPKGAFYLFPRVTGAIEALGLKSSEELVKELLYKAGVLVLPGSSFPDKAGEGFVRFSFATSRENIIEGVERIKDFIEKRV